jgi:hydroxypyruvate reductase/glycerate 2-kinase
MLINNLRELNEGYDSRDSAFINVALSAYEEAIKACDPYKISLLQFTLNGSILTFKNKNYNLDYYNNIYVIGAGKAGYKMGKAINELLGDRITEGCICVPQDSDIPEEMLGKIRFMECAHPIPDMDSILSARIITRIADKAEANDLIIFLLSGGASSLMCLPAEGITLAEKQNVNNLLLKCGADIKEINTVRKHLSAIKGGKLAEMAYPAETIQLIISDVLDNSLETIGSGPAVQDKTTLADAVSILKKHSIWESIPDNVANFLTTNTFSKSKKVSDDEKGKIFEKVSTSIIADNHLALNAIAKFLEDYDFKLFYYPRAITGEASEEAKEFFFYVSKLKKDNLDPFAVISGGEPVVTFKRNMAANLKPEDTDGLENVPRNSLKSNFKSENIASLGEELRNKQLKSIVAGGRAQEFALAMLKYFVEFPDRQIFFLAAGTDGIDGPTDAAGAIISEKTVEKAKSKNCNFEESLNRHDSYNFFKLVGGLIKTGYTGTNVNDIFIALVPPQID